MTETGTHEGNLAPIVYSCNTSILFSRPEFRIRRSHNAQRDNGLSALIAGVTLCGVDYTVLHLFHDTHMIA